jgi:glycosyltransferase involved in cell wall biosynthesis
MSNIKLLAISNYRTTNTSRPEAEMLIGLAKEGAEVTVMTYGDSPYCERFRSVGINIIDFHPEKKYSLKTIRFIRQHLKEGKYNVMYLFNNKAIYSGVWAALGLPVKVVLYRGYSGNISWYDPTAYLKHLHPRVDYIICNSEGVAEIFQHLPFFDGKKAVTINKGHDLAWYEHVKPLSRAELGLKDTDFLVACVANVRRMKGIPYLMAAAQHIPAHYNIHILMVGKGMDTSAHKKILSKAPCPQNVHFLGFQKDPLGIVAASDAFILPSIKGESITKTVLEAMSLGIAPIITDIAGNRELVDHERNGLVVPKKNPEALAKAMMHLYDNRQLCGVYGQASKERIAHRLSNANTVAQTKAFFEKIIA